VTTSEEAIELIVAGRVQGVGFRYFTQRAAFARGLTGWVRNMPDGSVTIRAKGAPDQLTDFCEEVRRGPAFGRVDRFEEKRLPAGSLDGYVSFDIEY